MNRTAAGRQWGFARGARTASAPAGGPGVRTDWAALGAFAVVATVGSVLGWSAEDLVWGLLLTSFVACTLGLLVAFQSGVRLWLPRLFALWPEHRAGVLLLLALGSFMGGIALLAVAGTIVILHTASVFLLYSLFPFWPEAPSPFDLSSEEQFAMLFRIVEDYWPFAAVAVAGDWRRQVRPLRSPAHLDVLLPLRRIGRVYLFMGLAMAAAGSLGTGLAFYWLIVFLFFFPWDAVALGNRIRGRAPSRR